MELSIVEKFVLLAQHPEKGRFSISGVQLLYGITGALLMELSMEEKIAIKEAKLILNNSKGVKDPILSEIIEMIRQSDRSRKMRYWMNKLYRKSNKYKKAILSEMDRKGLIGIEKKRFMGLIPYTLYYLHNRRIREKYISHLRKAVLYPSSVEVTKEDVAMMGLVEACKMHKIISTNKEELKRIRKELKEIIKNSPIAGVVDETIKQVQAAIVTTMIATTVVTGGGR